MAEHATALKVLPKGQPVFDEHHPPPIQRINECVHCGFCLPACPTYLLWHEEMDSPRGRIYLMKMGLEGAAKMDQDYVGHFDKCLGCMACLTACPSGVKYDELIEATRAQVERHYSRSFSDRLVRWLIFSVFPHPRRLRAMLPFVWVYQKLGLRWLLRRLGLMRLLPAALRGMEALLPEVSIRALSSHFPLRIAPNGAPRMRAGLLLGCVQRVFFDDVNAATVRVLAAEGCEVIIPREQGCCGALMTHAGREPQALAAARRIIDSFDRAQVDVIVTNAAGCGSNIKDYARLLRDDPHYAARAKVIAAKCKDVTEVLAELGPRAPRNPLPLRVAYQDSCHLQHAQGVRVAPRQLLSGIPGLELLEIAESAICCGSAGIYNLVQPRTGDELGRRKVRHVLASGAQAVASGNPGCLLQMMSSMRSLGQRLPAFHTIELLDASIRGVLPAPRFAQ
jgi:glycolate oxidase iron-sulfur subunit